MRTRSPSAARYRCHTCCRACFDRRYSRLARARALAVAAGNHDRARVIERVQLRLACTFAGM